jgi:hypothetical protein
VHREVEEDDIARDITKVMPSRTQALVSLTGLHSQRSTLDAAAWCGGGGERGRS